MNTEHKGESNKSKNKQLIEGAAAISQSDKLYSKSKFSCCDGKVCFVFPFPAVFRKQNFMGYLSWVQGAARRVEFLP